MSTLGLDDGSVGNKPDRGSRFFLISLLSSFLAMIVLLPLESGGLGFLLYVLSGVLYFVGIVRGEHGPLKALAAIPLFLPILVLALLGLGIIKLDS